MDKKKYFSPEMEEIEMKYQLPLCISGNDDDDDNPMSGNNEYDPTKPLD